MLKKMRLTQKEKSSLHYNGSNSYSFENRVKIYQSKAKYSELYGHPLCLESILKDL